MVNGLRSGKVSTAKVFSADLGARRNKIQGVKLPTSPAEAFDEFIDPVAVKFSRTKKAKNGPIKNLPSQPSIGIAKAFGTDDFIKDSRKVSRRLAGGFR